MPSPPEDDAESLRIGTAIHSARKEKGWSIKKMSEMSGLSTGMISQIERGLSLPSLKSLMMLATTLDVPIARFFNAPSPAPEVESSIYVVHKNERPLLKLTPLGLTKQNLAPELPGIMEFFEVKLMPGGSSGPEFFPHAGEKAGLVLQGRIRLWLNDSPTMVEEGDSFRFPSDLPHRFDNPGRREAHMVWILVNTEKSAALMLESVSKNGAAPASPET